MNDIDEAVNAIARAAKKIADDVEQGDESLDKLHKRSQILEETALALERVMYGPQGGSKSEIHSSTRTQQTVGFGHVS